MIGIPDPTSLNLSRRTGLPYDDVHDALAILANAGWAFEHAARLVEGAAEANRQVFSSAADVARAAVVACSSGRLRDWAEGDPPSP